MGVAFVKGLQGDDPKYCKTVATAKHFAVHSGPEADRHTFDVSPSERDLYETYLPAFQALVKEAQGGVGDGRLQPRLRRVGLRQPALPAAEILRRDWGFDGYVVSDCGAIDDIFVEPQDRQDAPRKRRRWR